MAEIAVLDSTPMRSQTPSLLFLLPMAFFLVACQLPPTVVDGASGIRELTILYSNDEHGWMEGRTSTSDAADLLGLWQQKEGYYAAGPFLLLSGGDHWTGPAISTWFEGESMVEVMNAMGYDASAIGNHEFDFGLDNLQQRIAQADYPYLAANIQWTENETLPSELGILASSIISVNDLRVAIIGLSTTNTPATTNPVNVSELSFLDYEPVLRKTVLELQALEPQLIFVVSHVCMSSLRPLAVAVSDLDISLMGGGHCNELVAEKVGDTVLLESNGHFRSYGRARFVYDLDADRILSLEYSIENNESGVSDPTIDRIVSKWRVATESELSVVLAFNARELQASDERLQKAVVESWLRIDSAADIAINNRLGLRSPLPRGEVTLADIVGLLPFENTIVAVELSGVELLQVIATGQNPFFAGLIRTENDWLLSKTGRVVDAAETYRVLVNSFMYEGGADYGLLAEFDDSGFDTEIHYRQPIVDWLVSQPSNADQPLLIR